MNERGKNPTNVLWVDLPNTHKGNEEALRQAMVAHGVVTNIKVFPERQYAFVEFATIEGASNAKNFLMDVLSIIQRFMFFPPAVGLIT